MADDDKNRLAGVAYVSTDGRRLKLVGNLTYKVAKFSRTTLTGQDGVHGYDEKPVAGFISGTFRDGKDVSLADINAMTNVTVVVELANGKTVVGRNMWTVEDQEVETQEGSFPVRWEGFSVEEA